MSRVSVVTRRVAMGCLPVFTLLALAPNNRAHAQFGDIFGGLTSTVTGIGTIISGINTTLNQMQNLENNVVHPQNDLANIHNNGFSIINGYRNWMGTVYSMPTNSAQTATAQALENQMLSGVNGTSPSPQLTLVFTNAYGARPTVGQAPIGAMQSVDMGDASAQDSLQLAVMTDAAASSTIQQANALESEAVTTSPGSAPQIEATALAYEIASMAVEHKVLASQLRAEASRLAYQGAGLKQGSTMSGSGAQAIFGGLR
jgi:hypothetical protein